MKQLRLVCGVLAVIAVGSWAAYSFACDKDKVQASAAANTGKSAACSAAMAAQCTPAMSAACQAKMSATTASVASASSAKMADCCAAKGASAKSASAKGVSATTVAVTAANGGADHCAGMKASAVTAANGGADHCSSARSAATFSAAGSGGSCSGKASTVASESGQCRGHGMMTTAAKSSHADCDACADMSLCSDKLDALGAHRQMVRLKNGVMFVYTADSPGAINAVQAAVAQRGARIAQLASMGDKAHLCSECKTLRGAMASGKLNREIVNLEGGSMTLLTSTDPSVIARLHELVIDAPAPATATKVASHIKS